MPTTNINPSDEASHPDYSQLDKEKSTTKSLPAGPQSESRSSVRPPRHDSQDPKLHAGERGSRKGSSDTLSDATTRSTTTTNRQRTTSLSTDRHKARSVNGLSNSNQEAISDEDSSGSQDYHDPGALRNQEQSNILPSNTARSFTRQSLSNAPVSRTKDLQHPQGATEDTSAKGSAAHHPSARRPQDAQAPLGHLSEDGQQDRTLENKQSAPQVSGFMGTVLSFMPTASPPPPKDKYQQLKEEYYRIRDENKQFRATIDNCDRELRRRGGELQKASHYINHLQHESQRSKDTINGLQNELINIHQQLNDAKALSEVRGKELFGAQVFLTKADTLSISEVGEKVTALNEEIFQAAATLGEALIHKRHDVSQKELEAAAAVAQEMVGKKMTNILIAQAQKPESEVNPLLVQVVLQIFMVKFCFSKIQSWYSGDSAVGEFLFLIYSEIRSTEEQAVSGRWRALTRAHTRPSTETWKNELYNKLQCVLIVASWKARSSENEESYGNRLPSIFKAINEVRTAIGEKYTSADLEIYVFECDEIYDSKIMEDAYGDGRQSSGKRAPEPIVGTTGIGLGKIMAELSAKDAIQIQPLIPAKIVLTSTMNEALEPIPPSKMKKKNLKKPAEATDGADQEGRNSSKSKLNSTTSMDTTPT